MTGSPSRRLGMPSGGTQPSTMSRPWLELASLAYPTPCLNLDGKKQQRCDRFNFALETYCNRANERNALLLFASISIYKEGEVR